MDLYCVTIPALKMCTTAWPLAGTHSVLGAALPGHAVNSLVRGGPGGGGGVV